MSFKLTRYAVAATMVILTAAACSTPPPTGPSALQGQAAAFEVSGKVTNQKGLPVAGVVISAEPVSLGSPGRTAVTDIAGEFVLAGLAPGAWELTLRCAGFEEQTITTTVNGNITLALSLVVAQQ